MINNIHLFAFPVNLIIVTLLFFVAVLEVASRYRKGKKSFLASPAVSVSAIAAMIMATLVLCFCGSAMVNAIIRSWPFALMIIWFLLVLAAAVAARMKKVRYGRSACIGDWSFLLMHIGLWVSVSSLYFGSCDKFVMTFESVLRFWNIAVTTGIIMMLLGACLMLKEVKR